ncbi:MAG: ParA family protein [Pseudomonadota bacterium]
MRTVLVANRKGGVGKTLISVNLAAALVNLGYRVALADADKQRSSIDWLNRRPATAKPIRGLDWSSGSDVGEAPKKTEWLVIDAPGAIKGAKAEKLIAEAEAVLCPIQPGFFDSASTATFLADLEEIKRIRKGRVGLHLIANRARANSKARRALDAFLAELERPPLAYLTDRSAYGDLAAEGLSIFDRPLKALDPIRAQWQPILDRLVTE